jgi:hypothetical protein
MTLFTQSVLLIAASVWSNWLGGLVRHAKPKPPGGAAPPPVNRFSAISPTGRCKLKIDIPIHFEQE